MDSVAEWDDDEILQEKREGFYVEDEDEDEDEAREFRAQRDEQLSNYYADLGI